MTGTLLNPYISFGGGGVAEVIGPAAAEIHLTADADGEHDAPDAHEWWRIYVNDNDGDANFTQIFECEMYESLGGLDVTAGATFTDSSHFSTSTADKAFHKTDYGETVLWVSASGLEEPSWIAAQLASPATVRRVMLRQPTGSRTRAPKDFDIQYSDDGSAWTTKWSVTGSTAWGDREARWFNDPAYTPIYSGSPYGAKPYWELLSLLHAGASAAHSMAELEFRATPGGADQTSGGTAVGHNVSGSFPAANAFDADNATQSQSATVNFIGLGYQFAAPVIVAQVAVTAEATNPLRTFTRAALRWSADGSKWQSVCDITSAGTWTAGEQRAVTDPNYI